MSEFNRRSFLRAMAGSAAALSVRTWTMADEAPSGANRLNILLITADDLNYDSLGVCGSKTPGITPNLDRLAGEGMRFERAHVTVAVCQPSRSALMTGRYPHRNGAMGFQDIRDDVPTLGEQLRAAGYINGIFAKVSHLAPRPRFCWDTVVDAVTLKSGRDPEGFYQHSKKFFQDAHAAGKPFFLMANSQDPHRPWAGSEIEQRRIAKGEAFPPISRSYKPDEVQVPAFLPDLPKVRGEMAQYYTCVHRCDEAVGQILKALKESGMEDNTLVMFLSDNGISMPFAKSNCYLASTRTPWIVRWPGKVKPQSVQSTHYISGIDFLPTVLEAADLGALAEVDGQSFVPLLLGREQAGRDKVVTVYHETSGKLKVPMRCIHDGKYGYVYNAWSDGKTEYRSEPMGGNSYAAMKEKAKSDARVAERVEMLVHRVPEELYDLDADPSCLTNLVNAPDKRDVLDRMRRDLKQWMDKTGDPIKPDYDDHLQKRSVERPT
jgi:N-sulfoglucosamine sulfohydrolase